MSSSIIHRRPSGEGQNFAPIREGTAPEFGNEAGLLDFRDRLIDKLQSYRNRHMQRITRNYWYLLGRQHIASDTRMTVDGTRAYVFRDLPGSAQGKRKGGMPTLPRPVSNYLAPAVEVEMAAQTKRQWTPTVRPDSDLPDVIAAAKVAADVLTYDLDQDNWPLIRDRFIHQTIVTGTGLLWSWWDENWNTLECIAPGTTVECVGCGEKYFSNAVDQQSLATFHSAGNNLVVPTTPKPVGSLDGPVAMQFDQCPTCAGSLQPYDLHPDELYKQDPFGRELGLHVPKGTPRYENVAAHEFYPDNAGLNTTPENIRRFAIRKVRSLSTWVEERYPDRIAEIEPDSPYDLMAVHPILGEWDYLSRYELGLDRNIYDEHVFVDTIVEMPSYRYPEGQLAVVAGDVVCEWGPLIATAQDGEGAKDSVPKHRIFAARYKERPDEFWGEALLDQQISPQNRINRIDMQEMDTMIRMGSPHILAPQDMQIHGPEWNPGYGAGKILHYELSLTRPEAKPEVFGGQYFYAHFKNARDAAIQDLRQGVGPTDFESGEAPKNIGTTSGLQVLGEQSERKRATRERSILSACESAWSHRLQLLWCLRTNTEQGEYTPHSGEGSWAKRQYTRLSIMGQTKVHIEKQAYIDQSIYQREAAREAQTDQLYVVDSPQARKRLLELRGLPTNVNEDQNRQIDHAEKQWSDFMSIGRVPVLDDTLDDPQLHHAILGVCLLRDETQDLGDSLDWPTICEQLAGWQDRLDGLQQQEAESLAFYGSRLSEEQGAAAYAQAYDNYDKQATLFEQIQSLSGAGVQADVPPPAAGGPPTPPPKPFFLPPYLPKAVLQVWMGLLQENGYQPPPPELGQAPPKRTFEELLRFRAVYEAYRLLTEAAMAAPVPGPASPGTGTTMAAGDKGGPAGTPPASGGTPVPSPPGVENA